MSEAGDQPMESDLAKSYRAQSYWRCRSNAVGGRRSGSHG